MWDYVLNAAVTYEFLHLDDVPALVLWQRRPVQESVLVRVPLGKAEPLGQIWKSLLVAFKHHGIIVNTTIYKTSEILLNMLLYCTEALNWAFRYSEYCKYV